MSTIDLSQLPAPDVIETLDYETLLDRKKQRLLDLCEADQRLAMEAALALESDPVTKLLEESAYAELILRQRINDAARAVMLAFATGADLDNLAALLGVARLDLETDSRLRARAQLAPEGVSTAGPSLAYKHHAMSAAVAVRDVFVDMVVPGTVGVAILANPSSADPGGVPSQGLLDAVSAKLSADDVRPLSDLVIVRPAQVITYSVAAAIVCLPEPDSAVVIAAARSALDAYVDGAFMLGFDITVSGLHAALHQPGVMRVDMASPASSISVAPDQAARCVGVSIVFGGTDQ